MTKFVVFIPFLLIVDLLSLEAATFAWSKLSHSVPDTILINTDFFGEHIYTTKSYGKPPGCDPLNLKQSCYYCRVDLSLNFGQNWSYQVYSLGSTSGSCSTVAVTPDVSYAAFTNNGQKSALYSYVQTIPEYPYFSKNLTGSVIPDQDVAVAVSDDGNVIAIMGYYGVYVSRDHGETWASSNIAANSTGKYSTFSAIAMDSTGQNIMVAVSTSQVALSHDYGETWEITPILISNYSYSSYYVQSSNTGQYLAVKYNTVYISDDYGVTWRDTKQSSMVSATDYTLKSIFVVYESYPSFNNPVGQIYYSSDYGVSFSRIDNDAMKCSFRSLTASGDGTRVIAITTTGDLYLGILQTE